MKLIWILILLNVTVQNNQIEVSIIKPVKGFSISSTEEKCNKVVNELMDLSVNHNLKAICLPVNHQLFHKSK